MNNFIFLVKPYIELSYVRVCDKRLDRPEVAGNHGNVLC